MHRVEELPSPTLVVHEGLGIVRALEMLRLDRATGVCRRTHHVSEILVGIELRPACAFPKPGKLIRRTFIGLLCIRGSKAVGKVELDGVVDESHLLRAIRADVLPEPSRQERNWVVATLHLCGTILGLLEKESTDVKTN